MQAYKMNLNLKLKSITKYLISLKQLSALCFYHWLTHELLQCYIFLVGSVQYEYILKNQSKFYFNFKKKVWLGLIDVGRQECHWYYDWFDNTLRSMFNKGNLKSNY